MTWGPGILFKFLKIIWLYGAHFLLDAVKKSLLSLQLCLDVSGVVEASYSLLTNFWQIDKFLLEPIYAVTCELTHFE